MRCKECEQTAKWLVIDQIPYEELFLPLCDEHFRQLVEMEGEMNLEFELIENMSLEDAVVKANEKWKCLNKKYEQALEVREEHG